MNVFELSGSTTNDLLKHAVEFHEDLNPLLFANGELKPDIRKALLKIAENFLDYLDTNIDVQDVTISGSNAAYSYTEYSDIDLHLVAKIQNPTVADLVTAKKTIYNTTHAITVKGISVEVYVQDVQEEHHSLGVYSVLKNEWIHKPNKEQITVNHDDVKKQYHHFTKSIKYALSSDDIDTVTDVWDSIKKMRRASLAKYGEFGVENLVFKLLRNKGLLGKLKDHINDLESRELSIENYRI
jgi:hypothetical protein